MDLALKLWPTSELSMAQTKNLICHSSHDIRNVSEKFKILILPISLSTWIPKLVILRVVVSSLGVSWSFTLVGIFSVRGVKTLGAPLISVAGYYFSRFFDASSAILQAIYSITENRKHIINNSWLSNPVQKLFKHSSMANDVCKWVSSGWCINST